MPSNSSSYRDSRYNDPRRPPPSGTALLRQLAVTYFDVADALVEIQCAEDGMKRTFPIEARVRSRQVDATRIAQAHDILQILVNPRPPGWPWRKPLYSCVDATIASRSVTEAQALKLFARAKLKSKSPHGYATARRDTVRTPIESRP